MNRPLLLVLGALVTLALWLFLDPLSENAGSVVVEPSSTESEVAQEIEPIPVVASEPSRDESRVESPSAASLSSHVGRRLVQVVDPEGDPVTGVEVFFRLNHNTHWREARFQRGLADPRNLLPVHILSSGRKLVSDEQGLVGLPEDGYGYAAARVGLLEGAVSFPPFGEPQSSPAVLQLYEPASMEVVVRDAFGQAGEGYEVYFDLADTAKVARSKEHPGRFDSPWKTISRSLATNEHGVARLRVEVPETFLQDHQLADVDLVYRACVRIRGTETVDVAIEPGQERAEIVLPQGGGMMLTLEGFPAACMPYLTWLPEGASHLDGQSSSWAIESEGSTASFRDLPLGTVFKVRLYRIRSGGPGEADSIEYSNLSKHELPGPTRAGDVMEHVIRMDLAPALTGRLVEPDGRAHMPRPSRDWEYSAIARVVGNEGAPEPLRFEVEPDGRFIAFTIERRYEERRRLDELESILISCRPREPLAASKGELTHGFWEQVPLAIAPGTEQHDLGDIVLGHEDASLLVRVRDESGQPVSFARCRFDSLEQDYEDPAKEQWVESLGGGWHRLRTHHDGELRLVGLSLRELLGTRSRPIEPRRYRLTVTHPDFISAELEFGEDQSELDVTLKAAHRIEGTVVLPEWLPSVNLMARQQANSEKVERSYAPGAWLRRNQSDELPFELKPLRNEAYDIEVLLPHSAEFVLARVEGVMPAEEPDMRLNPLRMEEWVDFIGLDMVLPDGLPLWVEGKDEIRRSFVVKLDESPIRQKQNYPPLIHDRKYWMVIPKGERPSGSLEVDGCLPVDLASLPLGENLIQLRAAPHLRLHLDPEHTRPEGWELEMRYTKRQTGVMQIPSESGESILAIPSPGKYSIQVSAKDPSGEVRASTRVELLVEAQEWVDGAVLDVELPERFVKELHELDA